MALLVVLLARSCSPENDSSVPVVGQRNQYTTRTGSFVLLRKVLCRSYTSRPMYIRAVIAPISGHSSNLRITETTSPL
jgi:hypothetical protein